MADATSRRPSDHLAFCEYQDGNIGIRVCADTFFVDICAAVKTSGLLDANLRPDLFEREDYYMRCKFVGVLGAGDHPRFAELRSAKQSR